MRLSKKLTLACLVLSFALLSGGCSYLPDFFGDSKNIESAKIKKGELERQRRDKQAQRDGLRKDSDEQQNRAAAERKKCNDMRDATNKQGKNPDDQKQSPQTYSQCQNADLVEEQAKAASDKAQKANEELQVIDSQIREAENLITGGASSDPQKQYDFWNLIWGLLVGLIALLVLAAAVYLAYRYFKNTIAQEREANIKGFDATKLRHNELYQRVERLEKKIKAQSELLTEYRGAIIALQKQAAENSGRQFQAMSFQPQPPPKPEPQFPIAAEDYLNKVRASAQTATADLIGGLLIQDTNKGNEFLIVKDNSLEDGLLYAVPNEIRFNNKGDYLNYYQKYYACENPSSGTVWIKSPTTVRRVDGGWKLEETGELEVR